MSLPRAWDPEKDDTLVCVGTRQETHDVRSFVFRADPPSAFDFLPGQFITLELEAIGLQRCYTIASPPTRPFRLEITTKRSGPASTWLHEQVRPGARLRVSGPAGDFSFGNAPRGKYLLLAAGAGITPLMSMARTAHDLGADTDIVLVQSARSPADLLFAGELRGMSARRGFRTASVVEQAAEWDGVRGRLSLPALAALVPDFAEREIFCCGPAPYMAAVRAILADCQFDMGRYHEESFSFAPETSPQVETEIGTEPSTSPETDSFDVVFAKSGRTVRCPGDSTILAAARAAGMRLPSACGKGVCGTCKSRMVEGSVSMSHGGGIRQREIDAGAILLCCAKPTSDLIVDR